MTKRIAIILTSVAITIIIFIVCFNIFEVNEAESGKKSEGDNKNEATSRQMFLSDTFPEEYKPYIDELKKKYPNWEFKALYTNLDWEYVINQENIFGKNLVPKSYSDRWKNTKSGELL